VKTSSIRFWAFSYSIGDPCGRSNQLIMYFIASSIICAEIQNDLLTHTGLAARWGSRRNIGAVTVALNPA
jgi:hypothetical protein